MSNKGKPAAAAANAGNTATGDKEVKSPRERWTSVGVNRVNNAIKALEILENCADKGSYEYTADEVAKMNAALDKSLATVKTRFADALAGKTYKPVKEGFSL